MPKENIHCLNDTQRRIEVMWMKGCWVQLGTIVHPEPGATADEIPDGVEENADGIEKIFVDLDRPGINRLITMLRRARDSAFGRDA